MKAKHRPAGRRLRVPSPAMTVACLSLLIALGGTSYAALELPRDSVGTPQLKQNAVISGKVKDDALTGRDINEAKLGRVPSASNANTLDGWDSSDFALRLSTFWTYEQPFGVGEDSGRSWIADTRGGELEVECGLGYATLWYTNTSTGFEDLWVDFDQPVRTSGITDTRFATLPPADSATVGSLTATGSVATHYTFVVRGVPASGGPRYIRAEVLLHRRSDGSCHGEVEVINDPR